MTGPGRDTDRPGPLVASERRRQRRRLARVACALLACTLSLSGPGLALAATPAKPRTSFAKIESELMCVVCHEPLSEANSPEAVDERNYLRSLIAKGENESQIKQAMVAAYTPAVLALPPAHGFNLLVYVVPPVLVAAGVAVVVITLPRWRKRSRAAAARPIATGPALDPADSRRLEEDLGRFA